MDTPINAMHACPMDPIVQRIGKTLFSFGQLYDKQIKKTMLTFYLLVITFANSLEPDQARHYVGPDLAPNCLTL